MFINQAEFFLPMIDYRSDTVTRPTPGMREAMGTAPLGDDVFGEDPSVNRLQERVAALFSMEAALFCPSGTMTNQIAIKAHTRPGDEVICHELAHVYIYEGGGMAFNSGVQGRPLPGDRGRISAAQVDAAVNPEDAHRPRSTLVCLENTANRGGGSCYALADIADIREVCDRRGLQLHLDGARLFNALVARNEAPEAYGRLFDSISLCLSKGLGCPVGSVLMGSRAFIREAHRIRKAFGGGMRQAGMLAAAGLYALDHHITRLADDHARAARLALAWQEKDFVKEILPVETNILVFGVDGRYDAPALTRALAAQDIQVLAISATQIRMVLHLDISEAMVEHTLEVIADL